MTATSAASPCQVNHSFVRELGMSELKSHCMFSLSGIRTKTQGQCHAPRLTDWTQIRHAIRLSNTTSVTPIPIITLAYTQYHHVLNLTNNLTNPHTMQIFITTIVAALAASVVATENEGIIGFKPAGPASQTPTVVSRAHMTPAPHYRDAHSLEARGKRGWWAQWAKEEGDSFKHFGKEIKSAFS